MKPSAAAILLCATLGSACTQSGGTRPLQASDSPPARVVIANTSLVDTVLALVPRERVVAVPQQALTWSTRLGLPKEAGSLATFPAFTAETVLAFEPDLVLCSVHSLPETVSTLEAAGVPTVRFDFPTGLRDVRTQLQRCAELLGASEAATELLRDLDARIAALESGHANRARPRALLFDHDGNEGWSSGSATPAHDILTLAGLDNAAADGERSGPVRLSLEQVLALDPDVLVIQLPHGEVDRSTERVLAAELGALRAVREGRVVRLHPSLFSTTSHEMVRAAETLADAVESLDGENRGR